jgi:hypothetical protein
MEIALKVQLKCYLYSSHEDIRNMRSFPVMCELIRHAQANPKARLQYQVERHVGTLEECLYCSSVRACLTKRSC